MEKIWETMSALDTEKIGYALGEGATKGQVYCLNGDLGVGKTVFSKGFAKGLGIAEHVNSPTFTIIQEYEGRLPLYHFDVYRISSEDEMEETGYEDYFYGEGVSLVEWAELIPGLIPEDAIYITIAKDYAKSEDYRKITMKGADL
ncbi:tRNA (adenosine(37)-N6)-threonylcarbamoyltransferase complex ATPase subunit type 1 TsaE [Chakrabartyella piscis]|uniref:tRNA (adenosine(37)-N6)-threonylcarbamoyltransferase complex ATPase subunit type 1 TsaE n=1 Tax=Chakrabartyella piscis TaxID=2918914 RepID=UPI002958C4EC|nr:tRNA (adenosine(37)-N6)-threonylcarbamoyltransferase complex ATPase subunit type 1 TsaE [Chakrabartyella piscis]